MSNLSRAIEEMRALEEADKPYWRIIMNNEGTEYVVACLQPFDESHYDPRRFLNTIRYETEQQAEEGILWLMHFLCREGKEDMIYQFKPKVVWAYYTEEKGGFTSCPHCGHTI